MKKIKIGGVPEHFNLAWYLTLKEGAYKREGINLRWQDYHGGTGQMCKALREKEIDLAVILTEGIIKDIINGNPSKIIQTFVKSPLIWGVHVAANSSYTTMDDIRGKKAAISRYGSGSHLMAYINAENNNWNLDTDMDFEVVKNLNGAVTHLPKGIGDYFMWEKFMTKPYVDNGTFRRIGNCPTPWPCFVIAVRTDFLETHEDDINTILSIINNTTSEFKSIPSIDNTIANRYHLELDDVQEWLSLTEWSQDVITKATIAKIQKQLAALDIINETWEYNDLVHQLC